MVFGKLLPREGNFFELFNEHGRYIAEGARATLSLARSRWTGKAGVAGGVTDADGRVTFGELIPAAAKKGLRLNMPLQPRQTKSVVGSMLSREPVIMPHYHWDISDPIGSTEVVFGTGDMFRTGAAAGPGSIEDVGQRE